MRTPPDPVTPPARYFPVKPGVFRFQAGLFPFGTDFGNGTADRLYFQVDAQREHYLSEKRRIPPDRHGLLARTADQRRAMTQVLDWMRATLHAEHATAFANPPHTLREISAQVQEDLVVMQRRADGSDAAIAVDVSFPSDWRPERVLGTDFRFIHGPVPGFADADAQARSLVAAMIDRGPHVRFVWTLKPDDDLDHHPDAAPHRAWSAHADGFLRVERQVTVPFPDVAASLFLIRTYLYPFSALSRAERIALAAAVESMPAPAAAYKGLVQPRGVIVALLQREA